MSEHDEGGDGLIDGVAEVLRAAEPAAPDFTARLMAVVNAEAMQRVVEGGAIATAPGDARGWWRRRRTLHLSASPLGALAIAAGFAGLAVLGTLSLRVWIAPPMSTGAGGPATSARVANAQPDTVHVVRFVFLAPNASTVAMVGDFNNWNSGITPLRRTGPAGAWTVSVLLPPGLHQYAFIVDGTNWTPDPATATTVTDDFGTMTSVIAVDGAS